MNLYPYFLRVYMYMQATDCQAALLPRECCNETHKKSMLVPFWRVAWLHLFSLVRPRPTQSLLKPSIGPGPAGPGHEPADFVNPEIKLSSLRRTARGHLDRRLARGADRFGCLAVSNPLGATRSHCLDCFGCGCRPTPFSTCYMSMF